MRSFVVFFLALAFLVQGCSCSSAPPTPDAAITPDAASTPDVGHDAAVTPDAPVLDVGTDASARDAATCTRPSYPIASAPTTSERDAVDAAVRAFSTANGDVAVTLDERYAVTAFSAPFPIHYDTTIADPCARALDALQAFFAAQSEMMRIPTDMTMRACQYDSLLDAEVVRLHGGTYEGRRLVGQDNDVIAHVTRSGTFRYWGGSYLPVVQRLIPTPCFDGPALERGVVGGELGYTEFHACVLGASGSYVIQSSDTRTAGEPALFVDASGLVHIARQIEVLLAASNVGPHEESSTLYCCSTPSLTGCVGSYVIVDEVSGEILDELPRCITC